ncbi:serine hydrolase domain-containing protein [Streptomyces parvus]|uniref:serine hydrolase domain-containing protein n=1 Tax=Streptomyces parvus TaxID=66428 RepID=UPI003724920F
MPVGHSGGRPGGIRHHRRRRGRSSRGRARAWEQGQGPSGEPRRSGERGQVPRRFAWIRKDGRTSSFVSGSARLGGQVPVPHDGYVRAGSNTKTFTAVVVLQMVAEGRVALDEPIETYLPGAVQGEGIDGRQITVRQLLQHTSGLPNYTEHIGTPPDPRPTGSHQYPRRRTAPVGTATNSGRPPTVPQNDQGPVSDCSETGP